MLYTNLTELEPKIFSPNKTANLSRQIYINLSFSFGKDLSTSVKIFSS